MSRLIDIAIGGRVIPPTASMANLASYPREAGTIGALLYAAVCKSHSRTRDSSQKRKVHHNLDNKFRYLLRAERQPLEVRGILDGVCNALDCQIGNVVSFISLQGSDANELSAIAMNAELFGLYIFYSEALVAENAETLGSLEMYCCAPRTPSAGEIQMIERAACLAAIAIQVDTEAEHQGKYEIGENRPVRGRVIEWPVSMN